MNAIQFLREMHADARLRLKSILAAEHPSQANQQWRALLPLLDIHEQLEDRYVYTPLASAMGPGTPLGDWAQRHASDVAMVRQLIAGVEDAPSGTPAWQMAVGRVADALNRHVMTEEGQIFGRIEQAWDSERLEATGSEMRNQLRTVADKAGTRRRGAPTAGAAAAQG